MRRAYMFLVVAVLALHLGSADDSPELRIHGTVRGSVTMRCVLEQPQNVDQLYFQKMESNGQDLFINGFYTKTLPVEAEYINRTVVNQSALSMELLNLSPADTGEYICIPFIKSLPSQKTKFYLTVTAKYSAPTISVQGCGSAAAANNCVIECSSAGGFPRGNITWGVVGGDTRVLLKGEENAVFIKDPRSQLWNVSQVITLNCSQPLNITCSVGGVVSYAVTVCPSSKQTIDIHILIAYVILLLVVIGIVIVVVVMKCRRAQPPDNHSSDAELESLK